MPPMTRNPLKLTPETLMFASDILVRRESPSAGLAAPNPIPLLEADI